MSDKTDPHVEVATLAACPDCGWAKHRRPNWCQTPKWHDKTDPRLGVADEYAHALATLLMDEREFLRLLDASDRAAGVVRVDTRDDLASALDMLVGILRADIATRFRAADPRLLAALDRVERLLAALREES